jgi:hypothetical protein
LSSFFSFICLYACIQLEKTTPDFQNKIGYDPDEPLQGNLAICSNGIGEEFDCLSMTLEMPFKDTADTPEPVLGWSPHRSEKFGASMIDALRRLGPHLLADAKRV